MNNLTADLAQDAMGATILQHRPALQSKEKLARLAGRYASAVETSLVRGDIRMAGLQFQRLAGVVFGLGFFGGWSAKDGCVALFESLREDPRSAYLPADVELQNPNSGERVPESPATQAETEQHPEVTEPAEVFDTAKASRNAAIAAGIPVQAAPQPLEMQEENPLRSLLNEPDMADIPKTAPVAKAAEGAKSPAKGDK